MLTCFGRSVPLMSKDHLSSAVHGPESNCWSDLVDLVSRYKQKKTLILPEKNGTIIPPRSMSFRITIGIVLFDDFSISAQPDKQA